MSILTHPSWVIYGLRENVEGSKIRYIGLSSVPMNRTLARHLGQARSGVQSLKCNWIRSVDMNITYDVIEFCPQDDMQFLFDREVEWIAVYRDLQGSHFNRHTEDYLTNMADGGPGIPGVTFTHTEYTKKCIADKHKGVPKTPEHRANLSAARMGQPQSEETREIQRQAQLKRWAEDTDSREAIERFNHGRWHDEGYHKVPREGCWKCPEFVEADVKITIKQVALEALREEPMTSTMVTSLFSLLPKNRPLVKEALAELEAEGLIAITKGRFKRWTILSSS